MKRHVALVLLAVTTALVVDLHVDWRRTDNGVLLRVAEHDIDLQGAIRQSWTRLTRRCGQVEALQVADPAWAASLAALRDYSPPDSRSARLVAMWRQKDWLIAQAEFDTLMPAIVTLRDHGGRVEIEARGIWSGHTAPWVAAPRIRDYLQRQVPGLPSALTDCLDIAPDSALQRGPPRPHPSKETP